MGNLTPWNELLRIAGETVEGAGKTLKDKRESLSIDDLKELSRNLQNVADVLDQRISFLQEG